MNVHAPMSATSEFIGRAHGMLIGGAWQGAASGKTFEVHDPATGAVIASVPEGEAADIDLAVKAARASFDDGRWRGLTGAERGRILWRFADLIEEHAEELAQIDVVNNGMPIAFARWMVGSASEWMRHFAGMAGKIMGRNASGAISGGGNLVHAYSAREPIGVAALILPWNGPSGMFSIKVSPALAAGCSVVLKPAENTPLSALRLGELAIDAGVPAGVLNIVTGFGAGAGQALVDHPLVDKISFTGSTEVGKGIVRGAASTLKRVTLELGGKSPFIVLDDADVDHAAASASMAIFANTGQVCFAGSRLFVQKKSFDKVVAGVASAAEKMKIGNGLDPASELGPLISAKQKARVADYIESGRAQGAELVTGGKSHGDKGHFVEPTVFANINADMRIFREEIFGPVLVVSPVDELDEIVRIANDTRYGLGAGIFTRDLSKAHMLAARIQSGNVWVNCYGLVHPTMPFGGFKESGWGREMSEEGLDAFLETKSVFVQLS